MCSSELNLQSVFRLVSEDFVLHRKGHITKALVALENVETKCYTWNSS